MAEMWKNTERKREKGGERERERERTTVDASARVHEDERMMDEKSLILKIEFKVGDGVDCLEFPVALLSTIATSFAKLDSRSCVVGS